MHLHPIAYWGVPTNLAFSLGYVNARFRCWLAKLMKGPNGFTWAAPFFLPSYVWIWTWWAFRHYVLLRNIAPSALAYKKYYLGRYPVEGLSKEISIVVDITAEFPRSCPTNMSYICVPSLDVTLPEPSDFLEAAYAVMKLEKETSGSIYVHCANGHGRSALFLVLIMMLQGAITTPGEGKDILRRTRPNVNWVASQEQVLIKALALHEARGTPLLSVIDHTRSDDTP
eukprot:GEMP01092748.1.p1 GENE.GEMP01092748.1~~GEMP01092748.1.p1  ORF type:complete len:227 (+),score=29.40 GEMP01092748.1:170-850(+)